MDLSVQKNYNQSFRGVSLSKEVKRTLQDKVSEASCDIWMSANANRNSNSPYVNVILGMNVAEIESLLKKTGEGMLQMAKKLSNRQGIDIKLFPVQCSDGLKRIAWDVKEKGGETLVGEMGHFEADIPGYHKALNRIVNDLEDGNYLRLKA